MKRGRSVIKFARGTEVLPRVSAEYDYPTDTVILHTPMVRGLLGSSTLTEARAPEEVITSILEHENLHRGLDNVGENTYDLDSSYLAKAFSLSHPSKLAIRRALASEYYPSEMIDKYVEMLD